MPEKLELAPEVSVPVPEDGASLRYSPQAVERVRRFFSLLVFGQNEWAGKPFRLLPWEDQAIREFFGVQVWDESAGWVRYRRFLYDEIAKKNGKSEFAAGLGLYLLTADGESLPNVGVFAADKANADIIYRCAKYMVEHTALSRPAHRPLVWCRDSVREIRTCSGGLMKVYSSDADTKHGYSFSGIVIDELHAQPNRRLWDVLTAGSDAARRQQAVIVLTTAGDDPARTSIGWEIHEKCRRILAWRRGEPERPLDGDDPQWCPIMYGIGVLAGDDPEKIAALDVYDEDLWKRCNPSYGVTIRPRQFRAEARAAKQSEAAERTFRWLRLNQWTDTKAVGWLPLALYNKTQWNPPELEDLPVTEIRRAAVEKLRGKRCYGGLDLSATTDLTAYTLLFPPQEGLETWTALFWAWRPLDTVLEAEKRDHVPYRDWARADFITLCPGDMVDYTMIAQTVQETKEAFDLRTVGMDPALGQLLSQLLQSSVGPDGRAKEPIEVIAVSQGMMSMSPPTKELERLIRKREMLHLHNTCARWCVGNARVYQDCNENKKLVKDKSVGRIDIPVSWIIALAAAMLKEGEGRDALTDAIASGRFSM